MPLLSYPLVLENTSGKPGIGHSRSGVVGRGWGNFSRSRFDVSERAAL